MFTWLVDERLAENPSKTSFPACSIWLLVAAAQVEGTTSIPLGEAGTLNFEGSQRVVFGRLPRAVATSWFGSRWLGGLFL